LLKYEMRQGNPISPYIFIICTEILVIAIREDTHIRGITIGGIAHNLSLYADHATLLFYDDEVYVLEIFTLPVYDNNTIHLSMLPKHLTYVNAVRCTTKVSICYYVISMVCTCVYNLCQHFM
jgi:hypothetical protein